MKLVLFVDSNGRPPNAATIHSRINMLETGMLPHLLKLLRKPRPLKPFNVAHRESRAVQMARDGEYSRANAALVSGVVADPNDSAYAKLVGLHPPRIAPLDLDPACRTAVLPPVTTDDVKQALFSFNARTAPGAFCMRPEHLTECTNADLSGELLFNLTSFVNLARQGHIPEEARNLFAGASLTGIFKKDGGIRPIAAGETLRRLIGKVQAAAEIPRLREVLEPLQMGVGSPMGAERIARIVENWRRANMGDKNKVLFKVDLKNAYNSISRRAVLRALEKWAPNLVPWFWTTYGPLSRLRYGTYVVNSEEGVQQGDPLGPLFFALGIHAMVLRIAAEVPHLDIHKWYLDDGVIAGSLDDVHKALHIIQEMCSGPEGDLGLTMNVSKCELICLSATTPTGAFPKEITRTTRCFEVLGVPIGDVDLVSEHLSKTSVAKAIKVFDAISALDDPQVAYV
eukprot:PhF_6_TR15074/c2_g1_i1/m.23702